MLAPAREHGRQPESAPAGARTFSPFRLREAQAEVRAARACGFPVDARLERDIEARLRAQEASRER